MNPHANLKKEIYTVYIILYSISLIRLYTYVYLWIEIIICFEFIRYKYMFDKSNGMLNAKTIFPWMNLVYMDDNLWLTVGPLVI